MKTRVIFERASAAAPSARHSLISAAVCALSAAPCESRYEMYLE